MEVTYSRKTGKVTERKQTAAEPIDYTDLVKAIAAAIIEERNKGEIRNANS